jgi:hypothetical protein
MTQIDLGLTGVLTGLTRPIRSLVLMMVIKTWGVTSGPAKLPLGVTAPLMLSQILVMVRLQECLLDLLEGQEIKMLMLILWYRKWLMFCKINSA